MMRLALSGCGAAARIYHRPALLELEQRGLIRVDAAYDPDLEANRAFCADFPAAVPVPTFEGLLDRAPEVLVVASPPDRHAAQAVAALRAGIAVLCEKPLAPTVAEAEAMVAQARASGANLSVGMIRRHLGPARMIRGLLANAALGRLETLQIFEGGPFTWPVHSPAYFRRSAGGTGVLEDIGTHVVDLVTWWLGEPDSLEYADDAMGGLAANCLLTMEFGACRVTIRLSRDWPRPNRYDFRGDRGWLSWKDLDPQQLELSTGPLGAGARLFVHDRHPTELELAGLAESFTGAFVDQLRATIDARNGVISSAVTGAEALSTVRLLERCHAVRRPMEMPWLR